VRKILTMKPDLAGDGGADGGLQRRWFGGIGRAGKSGRAARAVTQVSRCGFHVELRLHQIAQGVRQSRRKHGCPHSIERLGGGDFFAAAFFTTRDADNAEGSRRGSLGNFGQKALFWNGISGRE